MALGRLREMFGDALLVRSGSGMTPTPRALHLDEVLAPALASVHRAVYAKAAFDPAKARGTVRFASPDDLEIALLPRLLAAMRKEAPELRLVLRPSDFRIAPDMLDSGDPDLALTALPARPAPRYRRDVLYEETFEVIYDARRIAAKTKTLSLKRYLELGHVLVSADGVLKGSIDGSLAELGHARKVAAAVAHFSTLPFALRESALVANVPSVAAHYYAREFRLARRPLPFPSPTFDVALIWHARSEGDPLLTWFRERVRAMVLGIKAAAGGRIATRSRRDR
jgi:LysR family transcriptional activator of mexEF-oprN operon